MNLNDFMQKLDDDLTLGELKEFALGVLRQTGIHEWDVEFFLDGGKAPHTMTLGEWRPNGTMTANPKDEGGLKVLELA